MSIIYAGIYNRDNDRIIAAFNIPAAKRINALSAAIQAILRIDERIIRDAEHIIQIVQFRILHFAQTGIGLRGSGLIAGLREIQQQHIIQRAILLQHASARLRVEDRLNARDAELLIQRVEVAAFQAARIRKQAARDTGQFIANFDDQLS